MLDKKKKTNLPTHLVHSFLPSVKRKGQTSAVEFPDEITQRDFAQNYIVLGSSVPLPPLPCLGLEYGVVACLGFLFRGSLRERGSK